MDIGYFLAVSLLVVSSVFAQRPNIIFIAADDLGWYDVGFRNPDMITPNIDKLAKEGIIFENAYVQPLCTPWHLGFCKWECTPTYRGFDTYFGYYNAQEDYFNHTLDGCLDYRDREMPARNYSGEYSYIFSQRAIDIIHQHDASQLPFLYMPYQNVHDPVQDESGNVAHVNVNNTSMDDLGMDDLGMDDLGMDDLGMDDLGMDDLCMDDLGMDDLRRPHRNRHHGCGRDLRCLYGMVPRSTLYYIHHPKADS